MQMNRLTVDVVIPTFKPDKRLHKILQRLMKQTYPIEKIIIINTEKQYVNEDDYSYVDKIEFHHIRQEEFNHGGTRNMGVSLSDSDLVLLMTQDAVPATKYMVENLVRPFEEDNDVAVTYGRQLPASDCGMAEAYTRKFNYPDYDIIKTSNDILRMGIKAFFCSDVCAMYSRKGYNEVGGFPNRTIMNEDSIFAANAIQTGKKVYYVAKAEVIHSHNYTYIQQFHRNFDLGVSHRQFKEIYASVKSEEEGIRLVKETAEYLIRHNRFYLVPDIVIKSGFKFLGYRLGKMYDYLPRNIILKCTMSQTYWQDYKVNK
ncbi:MAG: glycosyltransferase family 2 protein [Lachnospiraceae bacterium]|nr:glycosyltransferase family 2 protein [Lachnospiraceae bacterium]